MVIGISFVLTGMIFLILGGLRIRWTTQFFEETAEQTLTRIIEYRNSKTRFYFLQLALLVIGLAAYVSSVITYLMNG